MSAWKKNEASTAFTTTHNVYQRIPLMGKERVIYVKKVIDGFAMGEAFNEWVTTLMFDNGHAKVGGKIRKAFDLKFEISTMELMPEKTSLETRAGYRLALGGAQRRSKRHCGELCKIAGRETAYICIPKEGETRLEAYHFVCIDSPAC